MYHPLRPEVLTPSLRDDLIAFKSSAQDFRTTLLGLSLVLRGIWLDCLWEFPGTRRATIDILIQSYMLWWLLGVMW